MASSGAMPYETHDLPALKVSVGPANFHFCSLFWHSLRYPSRMVTGVKVPLFERRPVVNEIDEPFRHGRAIVIRLWPLSRAIVIGWWEERAATDEASGLTGALDGSRMHVPVTELEGWRAPLSDEEADEVLDFWEPKVRDLR